MSTMVLLEYILMFISYYIIFVKNHAQIVIGGVFANENSRVHISKSIFDGNTLLWMEEQFTLSQTAL